MNAMVSLVPPDMEGARQLMVDAARHNVQPDVAMYNILIKGYASCTPPQPERVLIGGIGGVERRSWQREGGGGAERQREHAGLGGAAK